VSTEHSKIPANVSTIPRHLYVEPVGYYGNGYYIAKTISSLLFLIINLEDEQYHTSELLIFVRVGERHQGEREIDTERGVVRERLGYRRTVSDWLGPVSVTYTRRKLCGSGGKTAASERAFSSSGTCPV